MLIGFVQIIHAFALFSLLGSESVDKAHNLVNVSVRWGMAPSVR